MGDAQLLEPPVGNEDALPKAFTRVRTGQLKIISGLMGVCVGHVEDIALHMAMSDFARHSQDHHHHNNIIIITPQTLTMMKPRRLW